MKHIVIALLLLLIPALANSTTYYTAKTGSDSNSCASAQSLSTPKLTINGAAGGLRCLSASDTLIIKAGTYVEFIDNRDIVSGTVTTSTTVQAAAGEIVILRPTTGGGGGNVVWFYGQSYIVLDGLVLDGVNMSFADVMRINDNSGSGSHHIIIRNSELMNAHTGNCVSTQGQLEHHVSFINDKVHDCGSTTLDHGIYIRGANNVIDHCDIYNNGSHGVHIYDSPTGGQDNNIVSNNRIHNNQVVGVLAGSGSGNLVYNNLIYDNTQEGVSVNYTPATNTKVYNNTIYANTGNCVFVGSQASNTDIKNNICRLNGTNTIANSGTGTTQSNNLFTDPKFRNVSLKDFHLLFGSAAIDTGLTISLTSPDFEGTVRPQGTAYEIGAYEYKIDPCH